MTISSYRTCALEERPRLFSRDVASLSAGLRPYVRASYGFDIQSVRFRGNKALVQSIESGEQYFTVKGHRYRESPWVPRRDIWLLTKGRWLLAITYYPYGYSVRFHYPPEQRLALLKVAQKQ